MSRFEIYKSENYTIEAEQIGRAGYIFYVEQNSLPFDFELIDSKENGLGT